jgi:hypothetical protein
MMSSNAMHYSPVLAELLSSDCEYPLVFGSPASQMRPRLETLDDKALLGGAKVVDRSMADACRAALWLRFDFLDQSHEISQEIHTSAGSYWHAILHRREPDWANAKYWFARVGEHAIFPDLAREAASVARKFEHQAQTRWLADSGKWDPLRFVDLCEDAHRSGGGLEDLCRQVQWVEWRLLFEHCYARATKSS